MDIIALEDYSIKELDLSSKGIDFRSIYTMDGSDLLYFAGFQYSTSQSVIGTIDTVAKMNRKYNSKSYGPQRQFNQQENQHSAIAVNSTI